MNFESWGGGTRYTRLLECDLINRLWVGGVITHVG